MLLEACTAVGACCLTHRHTSTGTGSNTVPQSAIDKATEFAFQKHDCTMPFSSVTKYRQLLHELYSQLFHQCCRVEEGEMGLAFPSPLLPAPLIVCNFLISAEIQIRRSKIKEVEYCHQYYQNLKSDILLKLAFK